MQKSLFQPTSLQMIDQVKSRFDQKTQQRAQRAQHAQRAQRAQHAQRAQRAQHAQRVQQHQSQLAQVHSKLAEFKMSSHHQYRPRQSSTRSDFIADHHTSDQYRFYNLGELFQAGNFDLIGGANQMVRMYRPTLYEVLAFKPQGPSCVKNLTRFLTRYFPSLSISITEGKEHSEDKIQVGFNEQDQDVCRMVIGAVADFFIQQVYETQDDCTISIPRKKHKILMRNTKSAAPSRFIQQQKRLQPKQQQTRWT